MQQYTVKIEMVVNSDHPMNLVTENIKSLLLYAFDNDVIKRVDSVESVELSPIKYLWLPSVLCFIDPDTGYTYQNATEDINNPFPDYNNSLHLNEIEIEDWFMSLSDEDLKIINGLRHTMDDETLQIFDRFY